MHDEKEDKLQRSGSIWIYIVIDGISARRSTCLCLFGFYQIVCSCCKYQVNANPHRVQSSSFISLGSLYLYLPTMYVSCYKGIGNQSMIILIFIILRSPNTPSPPPPLSACTASHPQAENCINFNVIASL